SASWGGVAPGDLCPGAVVVREFKDRSCPSGVAWTTSWTRPRSSATPRDGAAGAGRSRDHPGRSARRWRLSPPAAATAASAVTPSTDGEPGDAGLPRHGGTRRDLPGEVRRGGRERTRAEKTHFERGVRRVGRAPVRLPLRRVGPVPVPQRGERAVPAPAAPRRNRDLHD